MKTLIILIILATLTSCDLPTMFGPPADWHYDPQPVEEPVDTIPVDTIPVDTTPICTFPEEIQEPQFCQAYHEITDIVQTDRVIMIGNYSAVVNNTNIDSMGAIIDSLWELYKPEYSYKTYVDPNDPRRLITFIKGTNDRQQFYLKAQIRYNGYKHFFGFDTKSIFPFGVLTVDQFMALLDEFPSTYRFNMIYTNYTQEDNIKVALKVLGFCKSGDWADFRFNQIPIPDSIPQMFTDSHWNTVLHGVETNNTIDLRNSGHIDLLLLQYDVRHQIITRA